MKNRFLSPLLLLIAALIAAVALAACGDDDSSTDVGDLGPDPATMVPADAPIYIEATVRPEGEMLESFNSTVTKLTGGQEPGELIQQALDEEISEDGFSYSEDIEPWLGQRMGGFVTDFDPTTEDGEGAVAIAVSDADAAQDFLGKARESGDEPFTDETYEGVDYVAGDGAAIGIDGDFMLIGTEQGFRDAVDAGAGDSLADDSEASSEREDVPENSIFSAYVDTQSVIDLIESSGELSGAQLRQFEQQVAQYSEGTISAWGVVADDAMTLAGSAPAPTDAAGPSDLVTPFPSDAWFAFAASDFGSQLEASLAQFEEGFKAGFQSTAPPGFPAPEIDPLAEIEKATGIDLERDLSWIGDVGGFVRGSGIFDLGGALVAEATDEQAAADTVDRLSAALGRERSVQISPTDGGFDVTIPGAPVGAQVAVQDGRFVAAAGDVTVDEALSPDETLEDSDRFSTAREALGEDLTPSFFLDFAPVLELIESTGQATSDPDYQAAKPYLDALDYVVAGSQLDGDRTTAGLVLGVKEGEGSTDTAAAALTP